MRVNDLSGGKLDYCVARILGLNGLRLEPEGTCTYIDSSLSIGVRVPFFPSVDWAQGGPLIDRERIEVVPWNEPPHITEDWRARTFTSVADGSHALREWKGSTPLIAAMRAYVASKFGEVVPDEE